MTETPIHQPSLPPTTTTQQDITLAGQRKVNIIWEYTQAFIAIIIVIANMISGVYYVFSPVKFEFPPILSSSLFLVIGFYFSRTNHSAIGGVGAKPIQAYEGR